MNFFFRADGGTEGGVGELRPGTAFAVGRLRQVANSGEVAPRQRPGVALPAYTEATFAVVGGGLGRSLYGCSDRVALLQSRAHNHMFPRLFFAVGTALSIRRALPARAGEAVGGRRACTLEVVVSHPGKVLLPLR